jgi:hypothetical protein
MQAAAKRLENLEQRWAAIPGEDSTIGLYLDNLLTAQVQLTDTEFDFAKAETTYNLALMNLKRATGTLLQHEKIEQGVACFDGLPTKILEKAKADEQPDVSIDFVPQDFFELSSPPKADFVPEATRTIPVPATDRISRAIQHYPLSDE